MWQLPYSCRRGKISCHCHWGSHLGATNKKQSWIKQLKEAIPLGCSVPQKIIAKYERSPFSLVRRASRILTRLPTRVYKVLKTNSWNLWVFFSLSLSSDLCFYPTRLKGKSMDYSWMSPFFFNKESLHQSQSFGQILMPMGWQCVHSFTKHPLPNPAEPLQTLGQLKLVAMNWKFQFPLEPHPSPQRKIHIFLGWLFWRSLPHSFSKPPPSAGRDGVWKSSTIEKCQVFSP